MKKNKQSFEEKVKPVNDWEEELKLLMRRWSLHEFISGEQALRAFQSLISNLLLNQKKQIVEEIRNATREDKFYFTNNKFMLGKFKLYLDKLLTEKG